MTTDPRPTLTSFAQSLDTTKGRIRAGRLGVLTDVYDWYLSDRRERVRTVLEIGVEHGGSLTMWASYFPNAHVFGVDISPIGAETGERTTVLRGDQADPAFRDHLVQRIGELDLVVDDGSHRFDDQRETLLHLWPHLGEGGLYIVEDVHTSYREKYGGALRKPGTFMEWLKDVIDDVHVKEHKQAVTLQDLESVSIHYQAAILHKLAAA